MGLREERMGHGVRAQDGEQMSAPPLAAPGFKIRDSGFKIPLKEFYRIFWH
jgi:hypothetical protein